jgi:hypothetical protein
VGLLSAIFTYAQRKRMITEHPVRGLIRYADRRRKRRLSDDVLLSIADRMAAATLRKLEGERSAVVVKGPRARLVVA